MNSGVLELERKYTWKEKLKAIGPGAMVTASFIGPGTVTTCTRAGASFGYSLLWTVLFAIISTIILQEMAAKLGVITQEGLGEAIVKNFENPILKTLSIILVGGSVSLGGMAYISGDLTGSAMGLSTIIGIDSSIIGPLIGLFVLALVWKGSFKILEKVLMILVSVMAVIFITTMIMAKPDFTEVVKGFSFNIPKGGIFMVISLIGTTIVPYNFFIHAASAKKHWSHPSQLELSKWDLYLSITLGGFITAAILITSGTLMRGVPVTSAADLSIQLEPLLGSFSKYFLSMGLFCAGLSAAISTPLGVSYTLAGLLGWKYDTSDKRFKMTNLIVVLVGIIVSGTGFNPLSLILVAQVLNGIILPVIVVYLVLVTSNNKFLGKYVNSSTQKVLGWVVAIISILLGGRSLISAIAEIF